MDNLQNYEQILQNLASKCSSAEKEVIVAETTLQNLTSSRDKLIADLEAYTGVPFDQVAQVLESKKKELDETMTTLTAVKQLLDSDQSISEEEFCKTMDTLMAKFSTDKQE